MKSRGFITNDVRYIEDTQKYATRHRNSGLWTDSVENELFSDVPNSKVIYYAELTRQIARGYSRSFIHPSTGAVIRVSRVNAIMDIQRRRA